MKKNKLFKVLICFIIAICIFGCENKTSESVLSEILDYDTWRLSFRSSDSQFDQESIISFQKNETLKIYEPVEDEMHYKILSNDKLYIGNDIYTTDENVKNGINSWVIKMEKNGSGFKGTIEIMNNDDKEMLGNNRITIILNKVNYK